MYIRKVTIAAIFICQLTLVPETLMSNNQAVFHVAINSLNSISENCSDKSTDIKNMYSLAISDLTSVFYQQNEKIAELEVDNVHLKDEIEYLKDKLSKRGENLHSRLKREPRLADYKEWPGFPSSNRKRKKSNEQGRDDMNTLRRIFGFNEYNNDKKRIKNQERINNNRIPDVPYVLQRMQRNDLKDYSDARNRGLIEEVSNSLMPTGNQKYRERDQLSSTNVRNPDHQYGFYDVFNVPYQKPKKEEMPVNIQPRNNIHEKTKNMKKMAVKAKPRNKPFTRFRELNPGSEQNEPVHVIVDNNGKFTPGIIVHSNLPGGMCQIVQSPETVPQKTQNVTSDEIEHAVEEDESNDDKINISYLEAPNDEEEQEESPKPEEVTTLKPVVKKEGVRKEEHVAHPVSPECEVAHEPEGKKETPKHKEVTTLKPVVKKEGVRKEEHVAHPVSPECEVAHEPEGKKETPKPKEVTTLKPVVKKEGARKEGLVAHPVPPECEVAHEPEGKKELNKATDGPTILVNFLEPEKNKRYFEESKATTGDPIVLVNLLIPEMGRKPPQEDATIHINFIKPFYVEQPLDEKKVYIHYIGVEGDSLDQDVPNYWVYPQEGQDLIPSKPNDWDYGNEELVLDLLPNGPWDLPQEILLEEEPNNDQQPFVTIVESETPRVPEKIPKEPTRREKLGDRIPKTPGGMITEDEIPGTQEVLCPGNGIPETPGGMIPGGGIAGTPGGMAFTSTFFFPAQSYLSGSSPIGIQNQRHETQQGLNVYGNYIVLTMQNPESLSFSQKKQTSDNDISSQRKAECETTNKAGKEEKLKSEYFIIKTMSRASNTLEPENLTNEEEDFESRTGSEEKKIAELEDEEMRKKESSCPQLSNLNDSFCNCTPCDDIVTERSIIPIRPECKHIDGRKNLHEVVKMGCSNLVDEIINKTNVNEINKDGLTALHIAAERGYTDVMNILIKAGADINAVDNNNNTALHHCATSGSANACNLLLSEGCDVKAQNVDEATALHIAVWKGNYEIVDRLLNYNDLFEITDKFDRSASDLAQEMNNNDIIELLEKNGIKSKNPPTIQNACGRYPSDRSAIPGELPTCTEPSYASSTISESKASITTTITSTNPTGKLRSLKTTTPSTISVGPTNLAVPSRQLTDKEQELFDASKGNNWFGGRVTKLCAEGLNVNVADIDRNSSTALHFASSIGAKLTTLILIRCGAEVNVKDIEGNTPLHLAVMNGKYWVADILLHNKANPFAVNNNGETPQKLAHNRTEFAIRGLFDARLLRWYNPERKLRRGEVTIHQWAKDGYYLGISLKCAEGIEINAKNIENNLSTALHLAVSASKNNVETVLTLLRCGADIHSQDANENTPLHLAILNEQPDVVITLLMNYADPLVPNKEGKTPDQLGQVSNDQLIKDTFISRRYTWYMRHFTNVSQQ